MDSNNRIKLAISPCPNDTYIFGAWINNLLGNPKELEISCDYMDIQELNEQALTGAYDVIKFSAAILPKIIDRYWISETGAAAGFDTGPILVATRDFDLKELTNKRIVLPGKDTTAALLFRNLFPEVNKLSFKVFSEIEQSVLLGTHDAGVIIHESRFNYKEKGLIELADLGKLWVEKTGYPIPLGLIGIRKSLGMEKASDLQQTIRKSLDYAHLNEQLLMPYIQQHASEMSPDVIQKHIRLYVNQFTLELGKLGRSALSSLFEALNPPFNTRNNIFI
ncbi:MAG: 1,4-dihydroxy-6-naphthoate synthase [Saprospiraceae bacterium]|nr:1,4-dihydroxy-6-naphthoate synthase [Saprospiraceae bacterium]MBK8296291.1 1,4-dihydroxy-6-naphthoate synthase [Saprospiraceae bacterium]